MERSKRTSSRNQAPVRRLLATAVLGGLVLTGCAPEDVAGKAARAPITTVHEVPKLPTPTAVAPTSRSSEVQIPEQATQSLEVAKAIDDGLETVVRRMQEMDGFETGSLENGNKWVAATVVAPTGSQLAPLVQPGHASAYRFYVESSVPGTIIPDKLTIGAYFNTNSDGSASGDEGAAFELVATKDEAGVWNLAGRTEGGVAPWTLQGPDANDHANVLLALAEQVSADALIEKQMMPYAQD